MEDNIHPILEKLSQLGGAKHLFTMYKLISLITTFHNFQ